MIPVFYIGDVSGEIHVKSDDGSFTIKVNKSHKTNHSRRATYDGTVKSLIINGVDCSERYKEHTITYPLLCTIYKKATGENLKYRSILSARNNLERVQEIIAEMAPSLRIDFAEMKKAVKSPVSIDDQIFEFWVKP